MLPESLRRLPYLVHTNRELGLMLRGVKPLAYFSDFAGAEPDCVKRYFRLFDRRVDAGRLFKREVIEADPRSPVLLIRRVFYFLPGHEWRVEAMLALLRLHGAWTHDRERRFGELLGYEDWQNDY